MCHEPDSRPPAPPVIGEVAGTASLTLTAADGNALAAFEAVPAGTPRAGVVILPDVRGLHPYYVALAERFAEAGLHAVAIDYFGRTAGAQPRDDEFPFRDHLTSVTPDHVKLDTATAADRLTAAGIPSVFTLGFCFGGGQSWRLAASDLGLAGAMGFYGRPSMAEEVADDVKAPVLMLVAGDDAATPVEVSQALADRLSAAGKDVELHVFDGAPHSFFDRSFADHAQACTQAWQDILGFVGRHAAAGR